MIKGLGEMRSLWRCLCHAVLWNLWKERNYRIFEEVLKSRSVVIDSIIQDVGNWLLATNLLHGLSLMDFMRDWVTCTLMNSSN